VNRPGTASLRRATFSARAFAVYVFVVAAVLVFAPNLLLAAFGAPPTTEVWIRVVGVLACMIGVYAWVGATHRPFLQASVYTRAVVFVALTAFALLGLGSPLLALFGAVDLCGGLWTYFALRADERAALPAPVART